MTLQRAYVDWEPDRYYWLSPDGEFWLEVTAESWHRAPDHAEEAERQLRAQLDGSDGFMPLRATRGWLQMQGAQPDRAVVFVD